VANVQNGLLITGGGGSLMHCEAQCTTFQAAN